MTDHDARCQRYDADYGGAVRRVTSIVRMPLDALRALRDDCLMRSTKEYSVITVDGRTLVFTCRLRAAECQARNSGSILLPV